MTRTKSSITVDQSAHCSKRHCPCPVSNRHPIWYTNGLCERHFFEMNLPSDDVHLQSKLLSKENVMISMNDQYQPLPDDIRQTREIFDGRQWRMIEQKIDHRLPISNNLDLKITTSSIENDLMQIFRLIENYRTIKDELKKYEQENN